MSACLAQQEPLKVAFLGPEGTFTQQAVFKQFGHSVRALPLTSIEEVFHEVESGTADFGVVPIENSSEGTVNNTLDMFLTSPLGICGEVELRIHHNLMGADERARPGRSASAPTRRRSRSAAAGSTENLPGVERVPVASNAEGARRARDEDGTAAIAPMAAAEVYGLNVLVPEIEDRRRQHHALPGDRPQVVPAERPGQDHAAGVGRPHRRARARCSGCSSRSRTHGISMTRIESRPSRRRKWDYVFFIDLEGHADDASRSPTRSAKLKGQASLCRVLGSYPRAIL